MYLVDNLQLNWSLLVEFEVVSAEDAQYIAAENSSYAQNYMLLKLLISRTRDIFLKFLEYLKKTQMYIYTYLFRGQSYIRYCLLHLQNILSPT